LLSCSSFAIIALVLSLQVTAMTQYVPYGVVS
jgi:hypothetical protein